MTFQSILFEHANEEPEAPEEPAFFGDLNLHQVLDRLTTHRSEYQLEPFFYAPLSTTAAVEYRQQVLRDLQDAGVRPAINAFAADMRAMRGHVTRENKGYYRYEKEAWFLAAVESYCHAVLHLTGELGRLPLKSRALLAFHAYLDAYTHSSAFAGLAEEMEGLSSDLAAIRYSVHLAGSKVTVRACEDEVDYAQEVQRTFARFQEGAVKDYRVKYSEREVMNHVDAQIVERVARLYPAVFRSLGDFRAQHRYYLDDTIRRFDREVQFYLAYLDLIAPLVAEGLTFSYPTVSTQSCTEHVDGAFDLALAIKNLFAHQPIVCNGFALTEPERIIVVTGPNQGGKTTFARMFGQLHYLAGLGLLVPGREVRLSLPDQIFTHFEREEDLGNLRGKLEDELVRIRRILRSTTARSVIVMNESFSSTTLQDAQFLGGEIIGQIRTLGALCVYVTFIDELASGGGEIVSMVGTVDPADLARRTYRIIRQPASGLAYALALAEKYGLTYQRLKGRMTP